jgi:hypothetical protein
MTTTMAEQEYELGRLMAMVERMQQAGQGERQIAAAVKGSLDGDRSPFSHRFRMLLRARRA